MEMITLGGGRGVGWSWKVFQKKKIFFFQKTFNYYILISQACPASAIAMRTNAIFTITASTCCSLGATHVAFAKRRGSRRQLLSDVVGMGGGGPIPISISNTKPH